MAVAFLLSNVESFQLSRNVTAKLALLNLEFPDTEGLE
jgi:hypothetical protein